MYQLVELGKRRPAQNRSTRRLFFAIYYKKIYTEEVDDMAFARAARTWQGVVKVQEKFDSSADHFLMREVTSIIQLYDAWFEIAEYARIQNSAVWAGGLFTHAQKLSKGGLEFPEYAGTGHGMICVDGTLGADKIAAMPRLNWDDAGYLMLCNCNSGFGGDRSIGAKFCHTQRVTTIAQNGYAYFSSQWPYYDRVSKSDSIISLWAYERTGNKKFLVGSNLRRLGTVFTPGPEENYTPSPGPYAPHEPPLMLPADVLFASDSGRLQPEADSALQRAVQIMNARPKGKNVSIEGHADANGSAAYNQKLSLERAQAVKQWLVWHSVPGAQAFLVTGYGETRPLAPNNSPQGRQKNRRVEIRFR